MNLKHIDNIFSFPPLIEAKADVNARDEDDNTALAIASLSGNTGIVKLLKKAGARE